MKTMRRCLCARIGWMSTISAVVAATAVAADPSAVAKGVKGRVLSVSTPIAEAEDGLLLGNGDLSVSVFHSANEIRWRLGKGDVWDRRFDPSGDPKPPHIKEIAHGIADEGWKSHPYGGAEAVALKGTDNPKRMKELCSGAPDSYNKRPYPCPKPVGELTLAIPPDWPGLTIRQDLSIEEGCLRITGRATNGIEFRATCFVPPNDNVLVVRWEIANWSKATRIGKGRVLRVSLRRWADPGYEEFANQYFMESGQTGFFHDQMAKCKSPLPPPTWRMLGDRRIIEQTFPADPTFPQGFRYVMAPFASAGAMENVDVWAAKEARIRVAIPQEANDGWLAVAVATTSDGKGPDAEVARFSQLLADKTQVAKWEQATKDAARQFWARSSVRIADPALENLWYETLHARRCTYKAGKTPPGLLLPSTVRDYSWWHGDYHTNYNFQEPFWADYTANQLDMGDAYFTGIQYFLQMGRIIAKKYYGTRGAFIQLSGYPIVATDDVLGAVPMGRLAYMTGWAVTLHWQRYLMTKDEKWLAEVGYPAIRDCALFYNDFMQKRDDGLYHIFPSNQQEDGFSGDPKTVTDRAQVMQHARYCLRSAILASEVLKLDADLRAEWRERLEHAAGDDGQPPLKLAGVEKHFHDANPPEFGFGRPYRPAPHAAAPSPWPGPDNVLDQWYPGQFPICAMVTLREGGISPEDLHLGYKRFIDRWRHPNGLIWAMSVDDYGHAGAWTETLGICAPLQEMMLQSFGGVLRVFPCWPTKVDASFRDFRAEGAFLVSARWADGGAKDLEILSEKGGPCRLYSPWGKDFTVTTADGRAVTVSKPIDGIYDFPTKAGQRYRLQPQ